MLDIFNIPNQSDSVTIFYSRGISEWQSWQKPRGCKFIWIMCIGGGNGGLGGAGAGGAPSAFGGSSGAVTKALFPANTLPDTLYIQPGTGSMGGAGAATNINNLSGTPARSFVSIAPSINGIMQIVCASGAAGSPEGVVTTGVAGLLSLGIFTSTAGVAAVAGGLNVTPLASSITCPGANGSPAGATAGAGIVSVNLGNINTPNISGGASGSIGNSGLWFWKPMFGLGATGGGGVASGVAANGGDANSYGCGGGGGGNSLSGTGGNGGRGGDGLVIIATF